MQAWSWVLTAAGLIATFYIGRKKSVGWAMAFFNQGLWIAYAIFSAEYGFIISSVVFAVVNARNWLAWRRDEKTAESATSVRSDADSAESTSMRGLD